MCFAQSQINIVTRDGYRCHYVRYLDLTKVPVWHRYRMKPKQYPSLIVTVN